MGLPKWQVEEVSEQLHQWVGECVSHVIGATVSPLPMKRIAPRVWRFWYEGCDRKGFEIFHNGKEFEVLEDVWGEPGLYQEVVKNKLLTTLNRQQRPKVFIPNQE